MGYFEDKLAEARAFVGLCVEIPVHYDAWMMGARCGEVSSIGPGGEFVNVKMAGVARRVRVHRMDFDYMKVR